MKTQTQHIKLWIAPALLIGGLAAGCATTTGHAQGTSTAARDAGQSARRAQGRPAGLPLGYTKKLSRVTSIDQALTRVQAALNAQGFGIITRIDVQATMKKKLGINMRSYWILGACNPRLAHKALQADQTLGLLLPCKVIVYQDSDGTFVVTLARPKTIFTLVADPRLAPVAAEVDRRIQLVLAAL